MQGTQTVKGFVVPYKRTRYHVPEFQRRGPRGRNEHFNHLHSSLRNIIKKTFDVWKQWWRMFDRISQYAFYKQTEIVFTSIALHNFIKEQQNLTNDLDLRDALLAYERMIITQVNDNSTSEPSPISSPQAVPQLQDSINIGLTRDGILETFLEFL
ncbi:hypothetical protein UlMin_045078 [Ulmus minor]